MRFHYPVILAICFLSSAMDQHSLQMVANAQNTLLNSDALRQAADYSKVRHGQSILVLLDGKIILEEYANGGAVNNRQMLASGSKSFVGVAAAAAVQDKIINLDDPVSEAIKEWAADKDKSKITYRQLLSLTSGLTPGERGNAVRAPTWPEIAGRPLTSKPGERFEYGPYHVNTFAYALERKLNGESFEHYLQRRILGPLQVTIEWRFRCNDGHPQVGGGAFMTARDWSKFGEFVRLGGRIGERQIIDQRFLSQCFQGSPLNPAYGLTWWLRHHVSETLRNQVPILGREWGDVANAEWLPSDLAAACGAGKQRLYVIPSLGVVIVRQASLGGGFSQRTAVAGVGFKGAQFARIPGRKREQSFSDIEFLQILFRGMSALK